MTTLEKRSLTLSGHPTSIALEPAFWDALTDWAGQEGLSLIALIARIDDARTDGSLASNLRVEALRWARGAGR